MMLSKRPAQAGLFLIFFCPIVTLRCFCSSFLQAQKRFCLQDLDRPPLEDRRRGDIGRNMLDLAIVGGGPGGLMSAWYLKKKLGELCRVTIYEASDRVGG